MLTFDPAASFGAALTKLAEQRGITPTDLGHVAFGDDAERNKGSVWRLGSHILDGKDVLDLGRLARISRYLNVEVHVRPDGSVVLVDPST